LWPKAPRPRPVDIVAGGVALVSLLGLFELAAHAAGSTGRGVDRVVEQVVGHWGAWVLLSAGLLIGLIVTVHFSPGALIATAFRAVRATFAERNRLQRLVSPEGPTRTPVAPKPAPVSSAALARSAASFATPPPVVEPVRLWEVEAGDGDKSTADEEPTNGDLDREAPAEKPVMHVVADLQDDMPEIEWKL